MTAVNDRTHPLRDEIVPTPHLRLQPRTSELPSSTVAAREHVEPGPPRGLVPRPRPGIPHGRTGSDAVGAEALTVRIDGDPGKASGWEDLVTRIWAIGPHPVTLDLSAVPALSSPSITALIRLSSTAGRRRIALDLSHVCPHVADQLRWAHLDHLTDAAAGTPRGHAHVTPGPRPPQLESWEDVAGLTLTSHGAFTCQTMETALHRSAIGDRHIEAALSRLLLLGPALFGLVGLGLIALERDIDERGGGWWAEVRWSDIPDALEARALCLPADLEEHLRAAAETALGEPACTAGVQP